MSAGHLPPRHLLLALAVVAVWGTNFVVIKAALDTLPPLLLATLRFGLAFVPAALFVKRPAVAWRTLAAYGVLIGAGQFGLLFIAMRADITPGLASLVIQVQVFFTIGLAMLVAGERLRGHQGLALALAAAGASVWAAVLWQSLANVLFGYAAWAWLLARHPAATVTPMALLVPVFGIGASALLLGEPLPAWKLGAAALVIGGLALNLLWPRLAR